MEMIPATKKALINAAHLFYPKLCILCKEPLTQAEESICLKCVCSLPRTNYHRQENNPVRQLFTGKVHITDASAWLHYEKGGSVQKLIHSFKYHGNRQLALQTGRLMAAELAPFIEDIDLLIPVPLHRKRERQRGYNQSTQICSGMASVLNVPICTDVLYRMEQSHSQTNKTLFGRSTDVSRLYVLRNTQLIEGRHVLLVDDVITSGSTVYACAETLLDIPDITVSVLTLACV